MSDVAHTLRSEGFDAGEDGTGRGTPLTVQSGVRRLTPTECARLQGFPDDWAAEWSDSVQYAGYGDAVTVNVVQWIGERIMRVEQCPART